MTQTQVRREGTQEEKIECAGEFARQLLRSQDARARAAWGGNWLQSEKRPRGGTREGGRGRPQVARTLVAQMPVGVSSVESPCWKLRTDE